MQNYVVYLVQHMLIVHKGVSETISPPIVHACNALIHTEYVTIVQHTA
ncbi:hypothetical protein EPHNCH_0564 [Anaplasma phagocytophilum str. NCH-1]|uniref:Uncharacterized protein n=2 Tax=Anaplasma phagocytophilum TaxID=948 RepID=Q2GL09_ANAPZ|nr:hypothetical protein APH_0334 [Anaplasma phagocytophilum str. HZ]KJV68193.1 hypothetical protein EPHNCH_0564 [Anaplasma phagocytophilum str. NCH-1]